MIQSDSMCLGRMEFFAIVLFSLHLWPNYLPQLTCIKQCLQFFGAAADIFLWRNKKVTAGVLGRVTAIWVLFELLEYHLLTLICHILIASLASFFMWSNASTFIKKSLPHVPEVQLSEELFLQVVSALRIEINGALKVLRDIASGKDIKKFLGMGRIPSRVTNGSGGHGNGSPDGNGTCICGSNTHDLVVGLASNPRVPGRDRVSREETGSGDKEAEEDHLREDRGELRYAVTLSCNNVVFWG